MRDRLRTLHAAGRRYRWVPTIGETTHDGMLKRTIRLRVWGGSAGKNGRALQADLISTAPSGY